MNAMFGVKRTAENMRKRYGNDAEIHCTFALMNNAENKKAASFWRAVLNYLYKTKTMEKTK